MGRAEPPHQGKKQRVRPRVLPEHWLGNQEFQVPVPAPPMNLLSVLGQLFFLSMLHLRKSGPGDLRGMLISKILGIRKQNFHDRQEKAKGGQNWNAVQRGHTRTLLEEGSQGGRAISTTGKLERRQTSNQPHLSPHLLPRRTREILPQEVKVLFSQFPG